ncbi:MAG: hypothetical protein D6805_03350 [Planctomycetota bacterium]|nr:MAG: hypothetical protein D6805_03350 [Planctomycetota bacterium]
MKKVFPIPPHPKNFSQFRGNSFPLKTPFSYSLLKPFLKKGFQTSQKLFSSQPFSKKKVPYLQKPKNSDSDFPKSIL